MYTIKKCTVSNLHDDDLQFIRWSAQQLTKMYKIHYKWENFNIWAFVKDEHLWVCYRNDEPVGFLAASLYKNFFDSETILLKQNLLFSLPNTKAAYLLFKEFVDFGKRHANHVLTALGKETNIKPESLSKFGFEKIEELYRLEIS